MRVLDPNHCRNCDELRYFNARPFCAAYDTNLKQLFQTAQVERCRDCLKDNPNNGETND